MRSTSPDLNQCAQRTTVPLPYSTVHVRGVIDWARGARTAPGLGPKIRFVRQRVSEWLQRIVRCSSGADGKDGKDGKAGLPGKDGALPNECKLLSPASTAAHASTQSTAGVGRCWLPCRAQRTHVRVPLESHSAHPCALPPASSGTQVYCGECRGLPLLPRLSGPNATAAGVDGSDGAKGERGAVGKAGTPGLDGKDGAAVAS